MQCWTQYRRGRGYVIAAQSTTDGAPSEDVDSFSFNWKVAKLGQMVAFMLPALTIPMAEPVMSMVDTICIGQFAGTVELASLGPANIVFAFAQYGFLPLGVAVIRLMAEKLRVEDFKAAEDMMRSVLLLAVVCGALVTGALELFAEQLIGMTGAEAALVPLSCQYLRARAWAQPAQLAVMVCQSALLAQKDSRTPALMVVVMAVISALGNLVFVASLRMGVAGAGMTTVATQYVGALALLAALCMKGKVRPGLRIPTAPEMRQLLAILAPLVAVYFCKNLSYIVIHGAATALPTVQLAAHQAVFALWSIGAFTSNSIEQVGLAFLPASCPRPELVAIVQLLLFMALADGLLMGGLASWLTTHQPAFFTQDTSVWPHMASVQPQVFLSLVLACMDIVCNCILIVKGQLMYLTGSFTAALVAVTIFMRFSQAQGWALGGVWWGVFCFFGARCLQSLSRVVTITSAREEAPKELPKGI